SIPVLLPGLQTEVRLTRSEFEAMIRPAISETIVALRRAIRSAGVKDDDISAVLLVGGSSRIPLVAQMVGAELGRPIAIDAHPKDAISFGAAIAVAQRRGAATPESITTVLADNRPPPPTMSSDAGRRPAPPTARPAPPGARPAPPTARPAPPGARPAPPGQAARPAPRAPGRRRGGEVRGPGPGGPPGLERPPGAARAGQVRRPPGPARPRVHRRPARAARPGVVGRPPGAALRCPPGTAARSPRGA